MSDTEQKKVTIVDIARRANVSASTVSRVLRGTTSVSDEKKTAVLQAVAALDYQPNIFAQSLASGQSMTIGVLTHNFGSPFYDGILQGVLQGLEETDYWPIFADGRWQAAEEVRALEMLLERRVDGLILVGGQLPEERLQEIARRKPLIVVARQLKTLPDHCIYVDNYQAGYAVTRFLLELGHRTVAHVTAQMHYTLTIDDVQQRYLGYQQALQDAGLEPDPQLLVKGDLQQQSGVLALETLLARERPFSAVFAANDQMAFGARMALYRRGIRVPEDVSIVGFDDEPSAAYMVPPLTTVRQPSLQMGRKAAEAVLALVGGESLNLPIFQGELVVRESAVRQR